MSPPATASTGNDAALQRAIWAMLVLVLVGVSAAAVWKLIPTSEDALPIHGTVPPFTLVERADRTLSSDDLEGRIWLASFIFTRCGGVCPTLTARLGTMLRHHVGAGGAPITAVSFSVDPVRDDPATLRTYASRFGADPLPWLFATGDRDAVEKLVRDGFHLAIAELPPGEREQAPEPITHSDRIVLVDARMRIRGYYHGTDDAGIAALERDLARLARSPD